MTILHIYRARDQRATRYKDDEMGVNHWVRNPDNRLFWATCCRKQRQAKNLIVHVYYDCTHYFCATGKGRRDPKVVAAKQRREHRNRSAAARMSWQRRETGADQWLK